MNGPTKDPAPKSSSEIGEFTVDPGAERYPVGPSAVSAEQETAFWKETGEQERLRRGAQELGMLGWFFGGERAPTNIAGLIIVSSMIVLVGSYFVQGQDLPELRKWMQGFIALTLGYLFGSNKK